MGTLRPAGLCCVGTSCRLRGAVFLAVLLASPSGRAQPASAAPARVSPQPDEALPARYVALGQQHFERRQYDDALGAWGIAYAMSAEPVLLFRMAETAFLARRMKAATLCYERFVRLGKNSPERAHSLTRLATLPRGISRDAVGQYWIDIAFAQRRNPPVYRRAHAIVHALLDNKPLSLYYLATSFHQSGELEAAAWLYRRYLAASVRETSDEHRAARENARLALAEYEKRAAGARATVQPKPPVQAPPPEPSTPPSTSLAILDRPAVPPAPVSVAPPSVPVRAAPSTPEPVQTPPPRSEQRVRWAPYLSLNAGLLVSLRRLTVEGTPGPNSETCYATSLIYPGRYTGLGCSSLTSPLAAGVSAAAEFYPLAGLRTNALRGLGIGGRFDYTPSVSICLNAAMDGPCADGELMMQAWRAEAGIRWRWQPLGERQSPALTLSVQYGMSSAELLPSGSTPARTGLFSALYQYVDIGAGLRLPYSFGATWYVALAADIHYHAPLSYGALAEEEGYGAVRNGQGLRGELSLLECLLWRRLHLRVEGYYELFRMNLERSEPPSSFSGSPQYLGRGLRDESVGGRLLLGVQI